MHTTGSAGDDERVHECLDDRIDIGVDMSCADLHTRESYTASHQRRCITSLASTKARERVSIDEFDVPM